MRAARVLGLVLLTLLLLLASAWAALALWFQVPGTARLAAVTAWTLFALLVLLWLWRAQAGPALLLYVAAFAAILVWWHGIRPSNARVWADDVAEQLYSEVDGDRVTLHKVRNFVWRTREDYDVRWETRQYSLSALRSVDVVLSYWMGPAISHTLVSFGFADGRYLTFSVEIRKEKGEAYSALGGFFKRFELNLIAADERDIIRVRSNVRGEDVYLYRVAMPPAAMRSLFLAYLAEAESLRARPAWYNTATANCTTIVFEMMRHIVAGLPLDYRLLLSGYLPEYLHKVGGLTPGYTAAQLRGAGRIDERARAADSAADFSQRIRAGVPGVDALQSVAPPPVEPK
ncbi:Lnb N-terminal periplasmic domain-containing protein [Solimonas soli]|uniref:Lnb N-terminal periplasmic domain-containing protein n=1 Tax=Solimonas soli TaxID=413479 RepID=UPI0004872B2F|nr:DUF4105 domain-containing protein [Solimonas soli]